MRERVPVRTVEQGPALQPERTQSQGAPSLVLGHRSSAAGQAPVGCHAWRACFVPRCGADHDTDAASSNELRQPRDHAAEQQDLQASSPPDRSAGVGRKTRMSSCVRSTSSVLRSSVTSSPWRWQPWMIDSSTGWSRSHPDRHRTAVCLRRRSHSCWLRWSCFRYCSQASVASASTHRISRFAQSLVSGCSNRKRSILVSPPARLSRPARRLRRKVVKQAAPCDHPAPEGQNLLFLVHVGVAGFRPTDLLAANHVGRRVYRPDHLVVRIEPGLADKTNVCHGAHEQDATTSVGPFGVLLALHTRLRDGPPSRRA